MLKTKKGIFLILILFLLIAGCGGRETANTTTTEMVSLTGQIGEGTISTSSTGTVNIQAIVPKANQTIIAIAKNTKKLYFADQKTLSGDGSFSIDVPANDSYSLQILDENFKHAAAIALKKIGENLSMSLSTDSGSDIDLGQIIYDNSKKAARVLTEVATDSVDSELVAKIASGQSWVPKGAGKFGKGDDAKLDSGQSYDSSLIDGDADGLPDVFDADNDGDGIIDEFDSDSGVGAEGAAGSSKIDSVVCFTNLKINYDEVATFTPASDTVITLEIIPSDASQVSSVVMTDAPTYAAIATVTGCSNYTTIDTYPSAGTLWPTDSSGYYKLYKVQDSGGTAKWVVFLKPNCAMTAGDSFRFRVNYTDSTSEDFIKMINYIFVSIPQLHTYQIGSNTAQSAPANNDRSNPIDIDYATTSTSEITLTWSRPTDEDGLEISGMKYEFHMFYFSSADGENIISSDGDIQTVLSSDDGSSTYVSTTYTLPLTHLGTPILSYQLDITARSEPGGDNTAQIMYFNK